jgi:class 3 adenylate cyclase
MAVFGAPIVQEDHADRAVAAAQGMHARQFALNARWRAENLPAFDLGIGLSTGQVAAALLGSEERVEYSCVGDAVNLAQRIQQLAAGGETSLSEATVLALHQPIDAMPLPPTHVKGRQAPVTVYKVAARSAASL